MTLDRLERWRRPTRERLMGHVDQRVAAVTHLSIAFGVLVGVGFTFGLAINLAIWLRSKRSPFVELHAEQAGLYQLIVFIVNISLVALWIAAAVAIIGSGTVRLGPIQVWQPVAAFWCVLTPLTAAWYFGTILYGVYAGLLVAAGKDFTYPIVGPWVRRRAATRRR